MDRTGRERKLGFGKRVRKEIGSERKRALSLVSELTYFHSSPSRSRTLEHNHYAGYDHVRGWRSAYLRNYCRLWHVLPGGAGFLSHTIDTGITSNHLGGDMGWKQKIPGHARRRGSGSSKEMYAVSGMEGSREERRAYGLQACMPRMRIDRKSTRLNSSHWE